MTRTREYLDVEEAVSPSAADTTADVRAWQEQRIAERLKAADAGQFASADAVRAVVRKFVPNG